MSTRRTRSSPNVRASLRELPLEPGAAGGLWREQRELLTGRRGRAVQLQGEPGDRGRRRGPLETGEQEALDRLGVGGRLGETLLDVQLGRRPGPGEGEIEVEVEPRPRGRQPARHELAGQGRGESMEDEAERLEVLDRGLDREGEAETLRGPARPERLELLAAGPGVDPGALLAEPGDQRGPGELGDGPDPAQAEAGQPGPDIRILR